MALSIAQQQQQTIFTKSPFKSQFQESNQFFENFNIKCLMNETSLLTPNKPNIPAFNGSSTKKRELTPISFMAINHLFNSPESKWYLKSLEKRGVAVAKSKTSNFEAKNDEFSLKLLKDDCNDQVLLNQPFSQINLIRTYSDPVQKKIVEKKNSNSGKDKNQKIEIDLFEILKHDLMMLEDSNAEKGWNNWSSYEGFSNEWNKRKWSEEERTEDGERATKEAGISILSYIDFEGIDSKFDDFMGELARDLGNVIEQADKLLQSGTSFEPGTH